MDLSDDDLFPMNDENETVEASSSSSSRNPVEEHLLKQLRDTTERLENARSNVDRVRDLTEKILKKIDVRETCAGSDASETDSDSYQVTGEPVAKKTRTRKTSRSQFLEIEEIWQRIIDDKWIVGIVLKNKAERTLKNPRIYVIVKEEKRMMATTSFWKIVDSMSTRSDEISPEVDKTIATVVLDLPNFSTNDSFQAHGTISYDLDDKNYQTIVPTFRLRSIDVLDKNLLPNFNFRMEYTILAIKSVSFSRQILIPIDKDGARLFNFLEDNAFQNFNEQMPDVYVSKNNAFFRHCIVEFLTMTENGAPLRISARTRNHLELIIRLLRDKFPEVETTDAEEKILQAARALENELKLEIEGCDSGALHLARLISDLLVP